VRHAAIAQAKPGSQTRSTSQTHPAIRAARSLRTVVLWVPGTRQPGMPDERGREPGLV
jgi:hypothetical protein